MKTSTHHRLVAAILATTCACTAFADPPDVNYRDGVMKEKTQSTMLDTLTGARDGACCLPNGACLDIPASACADISGEFLGGGTACDLPALGTPGTYVLRNHPDSDQAPPPMGLRLDELFDVDPMALDKFTFDFEAPGAAVFLEYDGTSIHISGTAFGGRDIGNAYDPAWTSLLAIDFTYTDVSVVPGDDDLYVITPSGSDTGSVTWLATNETIDLVSQAIPEGFTFRFGNEDDDAGHRGFDGLSGWGWLRYNRPSHPLAVQDWLFTAVGTCPPDPTGACCLANGDCIEVTEAECTDQGGAYQGDGSMCMDVECPQPNGACCLPAGNCVVAMEENCAMMGGIFQGDFTACDIANCPQPDGACCLESGMCVTATEMDCESMGGVYQGDDTSCDTTMCPQPNGACCLMNGDCIETTEEDCANQGGDFQGDFSMCADVMCPQPQGACCLTNGTCVSTFEADCASVGGTYQGDFTDCMDVMCPQPMGACCLADGTCMNATEAECNMQGGTYQGDFTSCDFTSCPQPMGACCLENGTCIEANEVDCTTVGGVYQGNFTLCDDVMCPQPNGACCLENGSCIDTTEEDCAAANGVFQGDFTLCDDVMCPQPNGACCLTDGNCVEVTEEACLAQGGEFNGDSTLCDDVHCPQPGACCFEDGTCRDEMVIGGEACVADGGIYQGDDTNCDTVDCPAPTGGCCLPDGSCVNDVTMAECDDMSGGYLGDDVDCSPMDLGMPGIYQLCNHPDGNVAAPFYGLRLDELFDVTAEKDVFTFDFEADGAAMFLSFDGTSVRIFGTAFGGLDLGDEYDPMLSSMIEVDFVYPIVGTAPGDDDLLVTGDGSGSIVWLATNETIPLFAKANDEGFSFRFGDEDDDNGHRNVTGISGWGWLTYDPTVMFDGSQDWIFTAKSLCDDAPKGACCLDDGSCVVSTLDECDSFGGLYQGDGTPCEDGVCTPVGACCLDNGTCVVTDQWDCVNILHGDYLGDGTDCPQGDGLMGTYYENDDFTHFELTRIDANIDFDWGNGLAGPDVGPNDFAIRWQGFITPVSSETYTFCASIDVDDAVAVWIDGVLVIDGPDTNNSPMTYCGSIDLDAGEPVSIVIEYQDFKNEAKVSLTWATPTIAEEVVPASALTFQSCKNFGACCLDDGTCLITTEWVCEDKIYGDYAGDHTTCDDVNCSTPIGACCLDDGSCVETDEWHCVDVLGGEYDGDHTWCADVDCSVPEGACCFDDGSCVLTDEWDCVDVLHGHYQGNNVWCAEVDCWPSNGGDDDDDDDDDD